MPQETVVVHVPDGDSYDTAEDYQSKSNGGSISENLCNARIYAEDSTSAHDASTVTRENTAVNDEQEFSQVDNSVYDLINYPNEPNDMSSPIKPDGFFPEFFPDNNQFSPITAKSSGYRCSKGTICIAIIWCLYAVLHDIKILYF